MDFQKFKILLVATRYLLIIAIMCLPKLRLPVSYCILNGRICGLLFPVTPTSENPE